MDSSHQCPSLNIAIVFQIRALTKDSVLTQDILHSWLRSGSALRC